MLFTSCFSQISEIFEHDSTIVNTEDLNVRGPIILAQMVAKILTKQNCNGSWGEGTRGCLEVTALAILSLGTMVTFPFLSLLGMEIRHAIDRGHELIITATAEGKPLESTNAKWLSATSYRSSQLCEAYVLAAASKAVAIQHSQNLKEHKTDKASRLAMNLATFFHGLPNLSKESLFKLKAAGIESSFYVRQLKDMRLDIFPATNSKEKDKYFHYIPIMWCIHNSVRKVWAPPVLIWDISVVSMFIFLVDEYMEGCIAAFSTQELAELRSGIVQIFALEGDWATAYQKFLKEGKRNTPNPLSVMNRPINDSVVSFLVTDALAVFFRWASYLMTYPSLQLASALDLHALRVESKNYLLYHIHQTADNQRLASQTPFNPSTPFRHPSMGYAPWLHTIGGGHIAATFALTWVQACVGHKVRGPGHDCFSSVKQKCMVWNANSHSAKQLRMFNDYGSVVRDVDERNLNSIQFPEFFGEGWLGAEDDGKFGVLRRKAVLLEAAKYERSRTDEEMEGLQKELRAEGKVGERLADWLGLYFAGGDQFSDMYLFKDITNSTK
jgi:hypothetical protein